MISSLGASFFFSFLIFEALNATYQRAYQNGIAVLHWTGISLEAVYYTMIYGPTSMLAL